MKLIARLLRPAANQTTRSTTLWQDPVLGYFETHGKTEFLPGEDYNLSYDQKVAVLARYRTKEILKREYLRREYDPFNMKYRQGIIVDPAMFRWYAADMSEAENFRITPRSIFLSFGLVLFVFYAGGRIAFEQRERSSEKCLNGEILWWDRQQGRLLTFAANPRYSSTISN